MNPDLFLRAFGHRIVCQLFVSAIISWNLVIFISSANAKEVTLTYYPAGPIYDYRWKLLELVMAHTEQNGTPTRLIPFKDNVTQNRGVQLLQAGVIDVIALGTNAEREEQMLPIKVDILRGIIGYRIFIIRADEQDRFAHMDENAVRHLNFGLNRQWIDLQILEANNLKVITSTGYENLFGMLEAKRFDVFTRGLNEAAPELAARKNIYPHLAVETTKALFFQFPIYFWVSKNNPALAHRIELGLKLALADGSFRKLFESYHAAQINQLAHEQRQVIRLNNPILPKGAPESDTRWWWH